MQYFVINQKNLHWIVRIYNLSTGNVRIFTVFPIKPWTPEKISGMFIVLRSVRCGMKSQKITTKLQHGLDTSWHETTSWLSLPWQSFCWLIWIYNLDLYGWHGSQTVQRTNVLNDVAKKLVVFKTCVSCAETFRQSCQNLTCSCSKH